jgi:hypothetical protein
MEEMRTKLEKLEAENDGFRREINEARDENVRLERELNKATFENETWRVKFDRLNEENADLRGLVERNEVELREGRENLERIEREFRRVEAELRGIEIPEPMPHRPQQEERPRDLELLRELDRVGRDDALLRRNVEDLIVLRDALREDLSREEHGGPTMGPKRPLLDHGGALLGPGRGPAGGAPTGLLGPGPANGNFGPVGGGPRGVPSLLDLPVRGGGGDGLLPVPPTFHGNDGRQDRGGSGGRDRYNDRSRSGGRDDRSRGQRGGGRGSYDNRRR